MPQKLIQAVNQLKVTASFQNAAYAKKFGFAHYGFDCVGTSTTIWSQGHGIVLATGTDGCYGNYAVAMYFDVEGPDGPLGNVVANYFHLSYVGVSVGQFMDKDVRLGVMGETGTYATGVHLHTEMRVYTPGQAKMLSPFSTNSFAKGPADIWFDPLGIIYTKTSAPDNQTYATAGDAYINPDNKTLRALK